MRKSKHRGVWVRLIRGWIQFGSTCLWYNEHFIHWCKKPPYLTQTSPSSQVLCQPRESFTTAAVIIQNVSFYSFLERCHLFPFSDAMECICISSSGGWSLPLSITRNRKNSRFLLIMMTIGSLPPIRSHDLWWHKL